jgi:hypothetical protein
MGLAFSATLGNLPRVVPTAPRRPLWLYPNLLSLDAPFVAVAWLFVFAKTWRVNYLPWEAYLALALVVWLIYVADRLLDASLRDTAKLGLEARHEFHRAHAKWFRTVAAAASLVSLVLVLMFLPMTIFNYLVIGGVLVAGFFSLSLFSHQAAGDIPYAKNILAGLAFAYGTSMVAHVYLPGLGIQTLLLSREFICFAVLCVLNISAIDLWEHANRSGDLETMATDELSLSIPLTLLGAAALVFALLNHEYGNRPFFYAILTGAALLQILNRTRARFRMDTLRVLADVAILAPILVFLAFPAE